MKSMISLILGNNPVTSILGIMIAGLGIAYESLKAGETNWATIGMAVLMGILGLKASDGKKDNSTQEG
jgi:hypothetical protein